MRKILPILLFVLLIAGGQAFGATHTVCDTGGPCDYTSTTFNALTGTDYAGDTFYFSGTFTVEIAPHISGTAVGGYVTLDGYQTNDTEFMSLSEVAGRALIDRTAGSGVYGFALWKSAWGVDNGSDYLIIQDFGVTDVHTGIYIAEGSDHIIIKRNFIHEATAYGVLCTTCAGACDKHGTEYITVGGSLGHGNVIKNIGEATAGGDVVLNVVEDAIVSYNHLYGGDVRGVDGVVPMGATTKNILIEYNSIHSHNAANEKGEDGIDIKCDQCIAGQGVQNVIVRYNNIYDHDMQSSVHPQAQSHHIYIYGNQLSDSNWGGVYSKEGSGGAAETVHDIYIFSNVIFDQEDAGVRIHADSGGTATDPYNFWIYNNTFAENGVNDHGSTFTQITAADLQPGTVVVKNNIFYKSRVGKSDPQHQAYFLDDITDKSNIDYNIYYWSAELTSETYLGGSWDDAVGGHALADVHSSDEDPDLTDIDANDYSIAGTDSAVYGTGDDLRSSSIAYIVIQGTTYTVRGDEGLGADTVFGSGATLPVIDEVNRDETGRWDIGAYVYGTGAAETDNPTPDPAEWTVEPVGASTVTMTMTATTGSDVSTPIEYYLNEIGSGNATCISAGCADANYGTGGTDSGWQESPIHIDDTLQLNKCYCYTAQMRDALENTGTASAIKHGHTWAATPGASTLGGATDTTLTITEVDENSNTAGTYIAVQCTSSVPYDADWDQKWVNDADGTPEAAEQWIGFETWDAEITVGSGAELLNLGTEYCFKAKAINADSVQTALGAEACLSTTGSPVTPPDVSAIGVGLSGVKFD